MTESEPTISPRELVLVVDPKSQSHDPDGPGAGTESVSTIQSLTDFLQKQGAGIGGMFGDHPLTPPEGQVPIPLSHFYVVSADEGRLDSLAREVRERYPEVRAAYVKPGASLPFFEASDLGPGPAPGQTATGDFSSEQGYLNPVPAGINAQYAWTVGGGRGTGVKLIDIEGAWNFSHEDLPDGEINLLDGKVVNLELWRKHGTAVLGMLKGVHNRSGVDGICPATQVDVISIYENVAGDQPQNWGTASAIQRAAQLLDPGDIILLELQRPGPANGYVENDQQDGYIAVEWWPCDWTAIRAATAKGIIVIAAAGNGGLDLSHQLYDVAPTGPPEGPFPPEWHNPFRRNPWDSLAVMVGAGMPPNRDTHAPNCSGYERSNFGEIVDVQGWGSDVVTSGGSCDLQNGEDENRWYTRSFNGTSSAAAMIAGAVACLQGIARNLGFVLSPLQIRTILRNNNLGMPQQNGTFYPLGHRIGPRPNLRRLIEHLINSGPPP